MSSGSGVVHHASHHSELAGCDGEQSFYVVLAGDIYYGKISEDETITRIASRCLGFASRYCTAGQDSS